MAFIVLSNPKLFSRSVTQPGLLTNKCQRLGFWSVKNTGLVKVFVTSDRRSHIEAIIISAPVAAAQLLH